MRQVKKGSLNLSVDIYIIDSTTGTPELGVLFNTAGIDLEYRRDAEAVVNITEVTLAGLTSAHADGGFLEIGHGLYRLDVPDTAFATGASKVTIQGTVTGMIVIPQTIQLVDFDPENVDDLGLTALTGHIPQTGDSFLRLGAPAGASHAADILVINNFVDELESRLTAARAGNLDEITAVRMATLTDWINGGRLDLLLDAIPTTPMRGTDSVPTNPALATDYTPARALLLDNLDAAITATLSNQTTILNRIGAFTGSGVNNILGFFRSLLRSDIVTDPTDIGGTFDSTTESVQALRDRGDLSWVTGGGGGITDMLNITPLIPPSIDLADTASIRLGLMLTNALDDLPSTAEITPGTISIERKAIGGTAWIAVVTNTPCLELAGLIYFDEVFDSASGYAEGDSLRVTFKSQSITVSANVYEITDATGRFFYTEVRQTMRGTNFSNTTAPPTVAAIRAEMDSSSTKLAPITEVRLSELDAANLPADIATINGFLDTEISDILLDTSITLDSKLNGIKAITDQMVFTVANLLNVNVKAMNDSTEAADDMRTAAETMVKGTAATGTLSTIAMTTNLTISAPGQYNGGVLIFAQDTTTAALRGQRTDITSTTILNGELGFTALTTAPVNGDTFIIV